MLLADIKKRMFAAMKAGNTVEKEILRVAVGEIEMAAARANTEANDAEAQGVLRKLLKSNEETLGSATDPEQRATLEQENVVLRSLLPQALTVEQIVELLAPVADAIRGAKADGQATGVAMKHVKAQGAVVEGKDVTAAVVRLRSGA